MSQMHALRYSNEKGLRLEQIAQPEPHKGEALIKVSYAGICSTVCSQGSASLSMSACQNKAAWLTSQM